MKKTVVSSVINEESSSRLQAKLYTKDYTEVPNRVLPEDVVRCLGAIFKELSGQELESEGYTFIVRSSEGILRSIQAPALFRDADYSEEGEATPKDNLVIRWGGAYYPVDLSENGFSFRHADPKSKLKYQLKIEKINKWEDTCLNVTLASSEIFSMSFPVRSSDWENKLDPDVAEVLLEDGKISDLLDYIQLRPNSDKAYTPSERLRGYYVKVASFPLGNYEATNYKVKTGGKFGPDYLIQVKVPSPFTVSTSVRNLDTGLYEDKEVEIKDWAIMKPNTALKRVFSALPQISEDFPANIEIYDHGEYNGKVVAKIKVSVTSFEEVEGSITLNF